MGQLLRGALVLVVMGIVGVLALALGNRRGRAEAAAQPQVASVRETPAPRTPPIIVGPSSLWAAYKKNEVGADNLYRDKDLQITAMIDGIRKDAFSTIIVELAASTKADDRDPLRLISRGVIQARFGDGEAAAVGRLSRGELVGLVCRGRGMVMETPVLDHCSVAWAEPKDVATFARIAAASHELCLIGEAAPRVAAMISAGHLPDGGALPKQAAEWAKKSAEIEADCRRRLTAAQSPALDCRHPAVIAVGGCDGSDAPQCTSAFMKLAYAELHH